MWMLCLKLSSLWNARSCNLPPPPCLYCCCRQLQASLAAGALAALDAGEAGGLAGGGRQRELLPMPQQGVRVSVPQLESLRLK